MDITYLGHSSFRLKDRNASLVTDPFDPKMVGLKYAGIKADIVTVSHDHADHNKSDLVKEVKKVISGPGEYEVMGVSILGIPSYHDGLKGELRGKNTIYVIEMDEIRIAHLGDLGHTLDDKKVEEVGNIDILMVPVGGEFTISSTQAVEVVQSIDPSIIIPMHYYHAGLSEDKFGKLTGVDKFLGEIGIPVEKMERLVLKKSDLVEDKKVIVLDIKS